ncbi:YslB family protein [Limosilactobacillus sp.]|uniref:YslB family protein n=1 Tax=Limosilactobacillus sp. TaxID=2773925 RepID=UPI00345E786A
MSQESYNRFINSQRGLISSTIRDVLLPAMLGKETNGISYWIGKDIAREYPVASVDDLITLTNQLGFGELSLRKENKNQQLYRLSGPIVSERLGIDHEKVSFDLEAGFLAMETEFQVGAAAEAEIVDRRRASIDIMVQHDPVDKGDSKAEIAQFIRLQGTPDEPERDKGKKRKKKRDK